jgi:hypothetical protein
MLAEAIRQLLPVADHAAHEINESWAVGAVQRADMVLAMWTRQRRGRSSRLDGRLPDPAKGFFDVVDNPNRPDPGQTIPPECKRPSRKTKSIQGRSIP